MSVSGSVFGLIGALALATCDRGSGRRNDDPIGTIALAVTASQSVVIDSVSYDVSGNGITPRSGQINVSDPGSQPSVVIGGVPAGTGYVVTMGAQSVDGQTSCAGSGVVDVRANETSGITIILQCRGPSAGGIVVVTGGVNNCPRITSYSGAPVTVSVGGSIAIAASALDLDDNPLAFNWTAPTGAFADTAAASTTFTCTTAGAVILTVAVSDGMCQDTATLPLTCVPFCSVRPDGTPCNDDNACTHLDQCLQGACVGSNPVSCQASDQCHNAGTCDPRTGICSDPPATNGALCNDGDACTQIDRCQNGECAGTSPVMCQASDQCHVAGACATQSGLCTNPAAPDGSGCILPHATAGCTAGACTVASCLTGFRNCDQLSGNGCEISVLTSASNCGICGRACPSGATCALGLCVSAPPANVVATPGGWRVAVGWNSSPGATSYDVLRRSNGTGTFQNIGSTIGTQFVDDAVAGGVTYGYAVVSKSEGGPSAPSAVASATPLAKQICVSASSRQSIVVYDSTQSGRAIPVRSIAGADTGFGFPQGLVANVVSGEIFVSLIGGNISVFPLAATGNSVPARLLTGASPGQNFHALDMDPPNREIFAADYDTAGKIVVLDSNSGSAKRFIAGDATQIGHPASITFDGAHGEIFVGQFDATSAFQQIHVFGRADSGNVAPRRTLGAPANTTVGGWAIATDRTHDEIYTACNCDNKISVFDRTATGNTAPKRSLEPSGILRVYALLMDDADNSVWVLGLSGLTTFQLLELPRTGDGLVSPLHAPITLGTPGRLARCN
jgi:hypothetical protein